MITEDREALDWSMASKKAFHSIFPQDGHLLTPREAFEASWHMFFRQSVIDGPSKNTSYRTGCRYGSPDTAVSVVTRLVFLGDVLAWWGLLDQAEAYYGAARTAVWNIDNERNEAFRSDHVLRHAVQGIPFPRSDFGRLWTYLYWYAEDADDISLRDHTNFGTLWLFHNAALIGLAEVAYRTGRRQLALDLVSEFLATLPDDHARDMARAAPDRFALALHLYLVLTAEFGGPEAKLEAQDLSAQYRDVAALESPPIPHLATWTLVQLDRLAEHPPGRDLEPHLAPAEDPDREHWTTRQLRRLAFERHGERIQELPEEAQAAFFATLARQADFWSLPGLVWAGSQHLAGQARRLLLSFLQEALIDKIRQARDLPDTLPSKPLDLPPSGRVGAEQALRAARALATVTQCIFEPEARGTTLALALAWRAETALWAPMRLHRHTRPIASAAARTIRWLIFPVVLIGLLLRRRKRRRDGQPERGHEAAGTRQTRPSSAASAEPPREAAPNVLAFWKAVLPREVSETFEEALEHLYAGQAHSQEKTNP